MLPLRNQPAYCEGGRIYMKDTCKHSGQQHQMSLPFKSFSPQCQTCELRSLQSILFLSLKSSQLFESSELMTSGAKKALLFCFVCLHSRCSGLRHFLSEPRWYAVRSPSQYGEVMYWFQSVASVRTSLWITTAIPWDIEWRSLQIIPASLTMSHLQLFVCFSWDPRHLGAETDSPYFTLSEFLTYKSGCKLIVV